MRRLNHTQFPQSSFWTLDSSQDAFARFCLGVEKHGANPQAEVTPPPAPLAPVDLAMMSSDRKIVSCKRLCF